MTIETTYDLGDTVHYVRSEQIARRKPCAACGDKGRIEIPQTKRGWVNCPDCGGYSRQGEVVDTVTAYTISGPMTIGQVRVELGPRGRIEDYMCVETGVGSGSVYPVDRLFSTPDAAEAFAEGEGWMAAAEALRLVEADR